jgi:8-oxo-dGTP diphosphatase
MGSNSLMKEIATILLFDSERRLLIYLRDNKDSIPFPDHWDFFGGHIEQGETPEQALRREVKEELGIELDQWQLFRVYTCLEGDVYPNIKHVYWGILDKDAAELTLYEGQRLVGVTLEERRNFAFANILGRILEDFIQAGLWPQPVDKFRS